MEQLANFVTKSFEYNNNRVLEMINMKQVDDKIERDSNSVESLPDNVEDDDESVDIEITDLSSNEKEIEKSKSVEKINEKLTRESENKNEICDNKNNNLINTNGLIEKTPSSPIPLIKKHILTKNWLISDIAKRKPESNSKNMKLKLSSPHSKFLFSADQENSNALNLIRVDDLVNKKHTINIPFRPKPVTELLKHIKDSSNLLPVDSKSEQFKTEIDEEKFKSGEFPIFRRTFLFSGKSGE